MSLRVSGKSKIFISTLIILLIGIICSLSFLDTPGYVHCKHIGICEFLDMQCILSFNKKIKFMNHISFTVNDFFEYPRFVLFLKNSIYIDNFILDFGLINIYNRLIRILNLSHKILFSPLMFNNNILPNTKVHTFFPVKINLIPEIIEIITTSIILS